MKLEELNNEFGEIAIKTTPKYSEEDIIKAIHTAQSACNLPTDDDVLISRNFLEQALNIKNE